MQNSMCICNVECARSARYIPEDSPGCMTAMTADLAKIADRAMTADSALTAVTAWKFILLYMYSSNDLIQMERKKILKNSHGLLSYEKAI
jgi:hypothetical protein